MRRNKSFIIGVISALLCAICVACYVADVDEAAAEAREEALAQYGSETVEVCVAKRDISTGETLDSLSVETKVWAANLLPDDACTDLDALMGQEVGQQIYAGEVITAKRVGPLESLLEVPRGYSAVSVPARDVQALGRAVKPGMRVDIYATGASSTALMAENVLVLATSYGDSTSSSSSTSAWVTVAVSPNSVEEIVAAAQNLELYFVLPEEENDDIVDSDAFDDEPTSGVIDADGLPGTSERGGGLRSATVSTASTQDGKGGR